MAASVSNVRCPQSDGIDGINKLYSELAALMMKDSISRSGGNDLGDRQRRLEQELEILGQVCKGTGVEQGSKESAEVLAEIWDHVEDELVSLSSQVEALPRMSGIQPGEVAQLVDDTADLEEFQSLVQTQAWKLSPIVPPVCARSSTLASEEGSEGSAARIPLGAVGPVRDSQTAKTAVARSHTALGQAGEIHSRSEPLGSDGREAPERADAPSSFRSAADLFPEVASKKQPQPSTQKVPLELEEVSQSILKRDARCRAPKRLHQDACDKKHEWSDAWLRIADADQLERLVPALEATIHRTDAADAIKKDDIAGLSFVKMQIEEVLILPRLHPELFQSALTKPARGLLLFGPPGTGKTLLAKWIAAECGATFFNVNASTVMSKWIGEAEKTVKALFQLAADRQPSVIFLDEIDSLLSQRRDADNEASRRVKNEFLTSLEGADTAADERPGCVMVS